MSKIRVMVVDDAVVIRKILSDMLNTHPNIEVVGTANNGRYALSKLSALKPDLIVLDVEMPEMDGLETLTEIRKIHPRLPVIMFSGHTQAGAETTMEALHRGASDFVTKPTGMSSMGDALSQVRDQLVPRVLALCKKPGDVSGTSRPAIRLPTEPAAATAAPTRSPEQVVRSSEPAAPRAVPASSPTSIPHVTRPPAVRGRCDIVAIGVSTGGPNALAEVIPQIPKNFPVPIVIVQHMPPMFTRMLAERLASKSQINVVEGAAGMVLAAGCAYIAPGDWHMLIERFSGGLRLKMNQGPQENSCRPAVDPLFRSVAETCGANVVSVILTGMGSDGTIGGKAIRDAGGQLIAQDQATSVVWGMPGSVVKAGLAEQVLPLAQIAAEITRRAQTGRAL